ncbi:MAG: hypothetical protein JW941_03460, partial [Candidatus Coatesbacteria bacterium]|nr:hypothetical protein [Candidatus Coatesbacteria bacterium]
PRFRMGLPTVSPLSGRRSIESEAIEISGAQITYNLRSHPLQALALTAEKVLLMIDRYLYSVSVFWMGVFTIYHFCEPSL